jgi:hypothetical protein
MLANAPQFDPNDPNYAMLMHGSDQFISPQYYPWADMNQAGIKGMPVHPSAYQGMSATLAPAALEQNRQTMSPQMSQKQSGQGADANLPTAGLDFNFSQDSKALDFSGMGMSRENSFQGFMKASALGSGQVTPGGEGFWDNFVMDGGWENGDSSLQDTANSIGAGSS